MIRLGDKVICIDNFGCNLELNKEYTVTEIGTINGKLFHIRVNNSGTLYPGRFQMTNCHILYMNGKPYAIMKSQEHCSHMMAMLQDNGFHNCDFEIKPSYQNNLPF